MPVRGGGYMRMFPKIGETPQNGWLKKWKTLLRWMIWGENPLFSETSIYIYIYVCKYNVYIYIEILYIPSLKLTAKAPENGCLDYYSSFLLGQKAYVRGLLLLVSGRVYTYSSSQNHEVENGSYRIDSQHCLDVSGS